MNTRLRLLIVLLTLFESQTISLGEIDAYSVAANKGSKILDTNAVIAGVEKGQAAAVDAALAGQNAAVTRQVVREFLQGGGDKAALRQFLSQRGGSVVPAVTEAQAAALRTQAQSLGRGLGVGDSRIGAAAQQQGTSVITNDKKFRNFLNAVGIGGEGF